MDLGRTTSNSPNMAQRHRDENDGNWPDKPGRIKLSSPTVIQAFEGKEQKRQDDEYGDDAETEDRAEKKAFGAAVARDFEKANGLERDDREDAGDKIENDADGQSDQKRQAELGMLELKGIAKEIDLRWGHGGGLGAF